MKRRIFSLLLALTMLCSLLPRFTLPARAEDPYSGSCGPTLSWRYDPDSHKLIIEGSGAMTDFARGSIPWSKYWGSIAAVSLPEGLTRIGDWAFYSGFSLTSVTIPNSVTSIGESAFSCSGLTSVTIPNSVASIGDDAFDNCNALKSVTIGNSVTSIVTSMFSGCSALTDVSIPNSVTSIGDWAFRGCSALTSVTIPNSVTRIGYDAFSGCSALTDVSIPNSVTSISNYAFYGCSALTSVTIPNSVTSIGSSAFSDCSSLTGVSIPNSVTNIDSNAFSDCSSLTSVSIPHSVTRIGSNVFYNCSALTAIHVAENNPSYSSQDGVLFDKAKTDLIQYPAGKVDASYTIPNSVTRIGYYAFYNCKFLTMVTIPDSVTSISGDAFKDCTSLTSVTIPNSVTSISGNTFRNCSALTMVTIPESVTYIGDYAFSGCSALTSVTIPNSVTDIGNYAFENCSALTSVTIGNSVTSIVTSMFSGCSALTAIHVAENNPNYSSQDGVLFDKAKTKLIQYPAGKADASYTIPNSVTSIGDYAFYECSALTSATIPNSVTGIGDYAFYKCSALTSATIPNSVTGIGTYAFYDCSALTSVSIGNSVTNIGSCAFLKCSALTSVSIGNSVTSIGDWAFSNCSALTSVSIPNSVTSIGNSAFFGCRALTGVTILNGVTSIDDWAFGNCNALTSVSIPDSVTKIGNYAFGWYRNPFVLPVQGFTVYGSSGSAAQSYAEKYGFPFVVYGSPVITAQPQSLSLALGQSTTFKVSATGDDLRYQWQYMRAGDEDWITWAGKTSASQRITASYTNNGCRYRCLVSNDKGSLYSEPATLTVTGISPQPVITGQPNSLSVTLGQPAVFQVTAGGEHLRYQWEYRRAGDEDWTTWAGRSSRSLKVVASDTNNGCRYRCLVSNDNGSLYSEPAILTVLEVPPVITGQPQSVSLSLGQTTVFKVSAIGGSLRYQWQYKRAGDEDWTSWTGKTFPSQKVTASETNKGCQYRCIVSNALGSVISNVVTLSLASELKNQALESN